MIKAYLEKIQNQLLEEKIELEKQYLYVTNTMKENDKMTQLLDEANDPNFESFTPRTVNARNKEKMMQLQEMQKHLSEEKGQLKKKTALVKERLEECRAALQQEYEREQSELIQNDIQEMKLRSLEIQQIQQRQIAYDLKHDTLQNLKDIMHKLELSLQLLDVDSQRCRLELSDVLKYMEIIMEHIRQKIQCLDPLEAISLEHLELNQALEQTVEKMKEEYLEEGINQEITYCISGTMFPVKSVVIFSLMKIFRNIITYAFDRSADKIAVLLEYGTQSQIILTVTDNGTISEIDLSDSQSDEDNCKEPQYMMLVRELVDLLSGKIDIQYNNMNSETTIMIQISTSSSELK